MLRIKLMSTSCEIALRWMAGNTFDESQYWLRSLQLRHNGLDGVSNHQPHDCLLNHLFRRRSKKTSKLRVTGLCEGNSTVTGEFPAQRASNAENVSFWWRHHSFDALRQHLNQWWPRSMSPYDVTWPQGINWIEQKLFSSLDTLHIADDPDGPTKTIKMWVS